jgi:hypothetical protein
MLAGAADGPAASRSGVRRPAALGELAAEVDRADVVLGRQLAETSSTTPWTSRSS